MLTFGRSHTARLWDATSSRPLGDWLSHADEIDEAVFLAGRPVIATVSRDHTARLWAVPAPSSGTANEVAERISVLTGMELGSDDIVRVLDVSSWKSHRDAVERTGATAGP